MIGSEESSATAKKRSEATRRAGGRRSIGADGGVERPERAKLCGKVTCLSAKVHESPRKFAQIRPVNPRLFGLLRVRPIFWQGRQQNRKLRRHGYSLLAGRKVKMP